MVLEVCLCFGCRRGSVKSVRIVGQLARDTTEDVGVASDAALSPRFVPGRLERLTQFFEQRPGRGDIRSDFLAFFLPR